VRALEDASLMKPRRTFSFSLTASNSSAALPPTGRRCKARTSSGSSIGATRDSTRSTRAVACNPTSTPATLRFVIRLRNSFASPGAAMMKPSRTTSATKITADTSMWFCSSSDPRSFNAKTPSTPMARTKAIRRGRIART
jgi:hypothetical protein